jgi:hypothetical protein
MGLSSARKRLAIAACAALVAPLGLACSNLIGLVEFEKGECPGARCPDDGGGFDTGPRRDGGGDAADARADAARGTDPVSWARWPMPSWDGGAVNEPQLTDNGDGTVVEGRTGLTWRKDEGPASSFAVAETFCKQIAPAGEWRLPKRIELVTLLDYGRPTGQPKIDPIFSATNQKVWTSSERRTIDPTVNQAYWASDRGYWVVNFETGAVTTQPSDSANVAAVRCVKGKL